MLEKTVTDWQSLAGQLEIEGRAFINGRYVDALSGQSRPTFNPGNGHEIVDVALCGNEDAEVAITGARTAFESGTWSKRAPMDRKMVLVRWAELIEKHADELALLETLDVGKPIRDTTNIDLPATVRTIRWSGEAIDKVYDEIPPTPADTLALVQRLPLGVVAATCVRNYRAWCG
jgi:4-guanidinobutyraldehyde dehydrogenase/NAD-dependent aldehyde dehydrogenase